MRSLPEPERNPTRRTSVEGRSLTDNGKRKLSRINSTTTVVAQLPLPRLRLLQRQSGLTAKSRRGGRKKRLRKSKLRRHLALQMPLSRAEIARRWRAAHPETVKAHKRRYYQKHKPRLIESRRGYKRLWRARNRQRLRAQEYERRRKLTAE